MDGYSVADIAVLHRTGTCHVPYNTANVITCCDARIAEDDILDRATANISKETYIIICIEIIIIINADTTDGVPLTIEGSCKAYSCRIIADGFKVRLVTGGIVPICCVTVGNIAVELKIIATEVCTTIYMTGEEV